MRSRSKLKLGEGELVEANPEIGKVYSHRRMVGEVPLESESQFMDSFIPIRSMVEEMYREFKKGQGESTSSPKQDKGAEKPSLNAPEGKGKGENPPPSSPLPSPPSSSSSSPEKEKEENTFN